MCRVGLGCFSVGGLGCSEFVRGVLKSVRWFGVFRVVSGCFGVGLGCFGVAGLGCLGLAWGVLGLVWGV